MMKKTILVISAIFLLCSNHRSSAQETEKNPKKMEWFKDAKLGIFIHWGIYSVKGISESWSFYNEYLSHEEYLKQLEGFTAEKYNPKQWVKLIEESGAKYTVITSKHHDGFALWDTQYGTLNAVQSAAVHRDVLSPFVKEVKDSGLKLGIYYSLPDWSHPDYTHFTKNKVRYKAADDPERWETFLSYMNHQLKELKRNYKPDLWWFDGDWEHSAAEWDSASIRQFLLRGNSKAIINSRLKKGYGDYETPENGVPIYRPEADTWELCLTMNDSWGYQATDVNYKTPHQIMDVFVDCISKGGNLLLDIGPKADGTIDSKQEHILKELGKWTKKHSSAIYGTRRGIPYDHFYGPTALSKDKRTLYLYVRDYPKDGKVAIKGLVSKINRAYVVGNGSILNQQNLMKVYWNKYPGVTYLDLPKEAIDPYYTVIALVLDGPVELYKDFNGAIESN